MWPTAAFRDICRSTIYPFEGAPHPRGCRQGGSKYRNGLVTPGFYIVVHCNYGSIWLRFRDMTRDRQTDRRTDRQTSAPFHDMATRSEPHNNPKNSDKALKEDSWSPVSSVRCRFLMITQFCPCDAMLAPPLPLSGCLSVCHTCEPCRNGYTDRHGSCAVVPCSAWYIFA